MALKKKAPLKKKSQGKKASALQISCTQKADPKLLELLVCPVTRGALSYDAKRQELISREAKLAYPIRDGIPIMIEEEARQLQDPLEP